MHVRVFGLVLVLALVAGIVPSADLYAQAEKVYWTDFGLEKIKRADVDGSNVETLLTSTLTQPFELDIDQIGKKMYWTETLGSAIQRADLDGANVETIVTIGLTTPRGIAVDGVNGKIYWTDWGTKKIQRADLDGSNVEDLVTSGIDTPRGLVLHIAAGKMYWTDSILKKIMRANLDGSAVEDIITVGLDTSVGIDLDRIAGKIYWTDLLTASIHRANLDGTNVEAIISVGLLDPSYISVDADLGKIFWTDFGTAWIQSANLDGTSIQNVVTAGLSIPTGIALATSAALPVELVSFRARAEDRDVVLSWRTASEINSAGFQVQMDSGSGWADLGFVDGVGTITSVTDYEYRVPDLSPAVYRFRLKQIDFDGAFEYSDVVESVVELPSGHVVGAAYPNPFSHSTRINLAVRDAQHVRVAIYDVQGREVGIPFSRMVGSGDSVAVDVLGDDLSAGVYFIVVEGERFRESRKIVMIE